MKNKVIIRQYFMLNPTERLRVRQIEKNARVPLPSAIRYAKELEQEHFLKSELISNIKLYSADRTSEHFLLEKKLDNIRRLYSCGLVEHLREKYENPAIVLFGSHSRGEDTEKSDIDIFIEYPKEKKIITEKFEKELRRKIHIFRNRNIQSIRNTELANNIANGIVLNGFLEIFR